MIKLIFSKSNNQMQELKNEENDYDSLKKLIICLASFFFVNVIIFLTNIWLYINNLYFYYPLTELSSLILTIGILFYALRLKEKTSSFKFLYDLWIFGVLISKSMLFIASYLYKGNTINHWFIVMGVTFCLFITGLYFNNKYIKIISVILIIIQFISESLTRVSVTIMNDQIVQLHLGPVFFNILNLIICLFLYRYVHSIYQSDNKNNECYSTDK